MAHNAVMSNVDSEFDQQRLERPPQLSHLYESKVGLFVQEMLNELRASYTSIRALNQVKLVVTDLDDTLWRGLVGEGDQLTNEGWPHGYAEALSFLSKRGVLVAAISKNDEDVVRKNWRSIVPIKDFVALKVNWKDKVTNMQEILESVNLLPESVVYIDDNPVERANMNRAFPAMRVLGGHPYELRRILLWSPETQAPHLTDEALRKWEMVSRQIQRENLKRRVSREDFLNSLNVTVDARQILSASDPAFSRALELLNKTNQFNTTGKRWSQQEAAESLRRGVRWYCFACADTFTDYGIVSVVLVGDSVIQQIVLSCRVFGFEVENAILSVLAELENLRPTITVSFKATEKNQVALQSLRDMGFVDGDHGLSIASQRLGSLPKHIKRSR
jgi:FkbH-like protein